MMTHSVLYLGLNPTHYITQGIVTHCPIIHIKARPYDDFLIQEALKDFHLYSHVIFTSKTTVKILCEYLKLKNISRRLGEDKHVIAVGEITASYLREYGVESITVPKKETAEGIVEELVKIHTAKAHYFWPHSCKSRPVIQNFFDGVEATYKSCILYDTEIRIPSPIPNLSEFQEIVFTSPSTVDAFMKIFGAFPCHIKYTPIGEITAHYLYEQIAAEVSI